MALKVYNRAGPLHLGQQVTGELGLTRRLLGPLTSVLAT